MITPDQDSIESNHNPHLRLAIAIVEQAMSDIAHAGKVAALCDEGDAERPVAMRNAKELADEARDFLLHRLWEPNNPFGDLLRHHGVGRMTKQRLIHGSWSIGQS